MTSKRNSNISTKIKAKLQSSGLMPLGRRGAKKLQNIFFNLENYNWKTINEIKQENGKTTTDETQILSMYHSNLYNSQATDAQDSFKLFTDSKEISKLDDAERDALDGPLTYEECKILL